MKKARLFLIFSGVSLLLFFGLLLAVKLVDVAPIGPFGSEVGLAALNGGFLELVGYNEAWYTLSEYTIYLAILTALFFVALGAYQLVKRRSLRLVDADVYALGAILALVIAAYLIFELFPINYRPVLTEGELEASFPSTHTTVVLTVMILAAAQAWKRIKHRVLRFSVAAAALLVADFTLISRLLSGVHWLTDILGGVLFSAFAVLGYLGVYRILKIKGYIKTAEN